MDKTSIETAIDAYTASLTDPLNAQIASLQAQLYACQHPSILTLDLSGVPLGKVTAVSAGKMFGQPGKLAADANWKHTTVVADADGTRWLRQTFPAGAAGQGSANGISIGIPFGVKVDAADVDMVIRYSPNFDATYGVKGPGLVGLGPDQTSLTFPSGGKADPAGSGVSARWMVFNQKSLSGHVVKHPNEWALYTYHNSLSEQYIWSGVTISPGDAYRVREHIELASLGKGVAQVWIDDALVIDDHGYDWRRRDDVHLLGLIWSVFRGGPNGNALYAQKDESYLDIRDGLRVSRPSTL